MNSRRSLTLLITVLLLVSFMLVACERPLQTTDNNSTAEEAYPAATNDTTTGDTTGEAADTGAEEAVDAPPADTGDAGTGETGDAAAGDAAAGESGEAATGDTGEVASGETGDEGATGTEGEATDSSAGETGTEQPAGTDEGATALEGIAHTVAEGETIFDIAARYGASWVIVAEYNKVADVSTLQVGGIIFIPDEEAAAAIRDQLAAQLADAGVGDAATGETTTDTGTGDAESGETESTDTGTGGEPEEAAGTGTATETIYVVKQGDTLYRIGLMYGISWVQIAEANGITNPNRIYAGQELKIPVYAPGPTPQFTHVVQRGETLSEIAQQYGVSLQAIAQANNLRPPYNIYAGQTLVIPGNG